MRFCTFLFAFLLTSSFLPAQQARDYYVTVNADTVYGKIKLNKTDFTLTKFKKPGGDYQALSGEVIRFYDAAGQESYVRLELVSGSSSFYREEIAGPVTLVLSPANYYLINRQDKYVEILRDMKLTVGQYGNSIPAIKNLLEGCSAVGEKEIKAIYSESEIVLVRLYSLVRTYNRCVQPEALTVPEKKKKSVFSLELMAAAGIGTAKPSITDGDLFKSDFDNSSYSQYQVRVKLGYSPRKNKVNIAIGYTRSSFHSSQAKSEPLGNTGTREYRYTSEVSLNLTDVSISAEYYIFLNPTFYLYPTVGHSMVRTDIEKLQVRREYVFNDLVTSIRGRNLSNENLQNDFDPSFFLGLGLNYKITGRLRSSLEFVQYTRMNIIFNPMINQPVFELKRNNLRLGLSFMLVKD